MQSEEGEFPALRMLIVIFLYYEMNSSKCCNNEMVEFHFLHGFELKSKETVFNQFNKSGISKSYGIACLRFIMESWIAL